jgi:hypothetical protein
VRIDEAYGDRTREHWDLFLKRSPPFLLMAKLTGLEPAASGVTGRRSNQLSYNSNLWCLGVESNHRHPDFQSGALPAELPRRDLFPWGPDPALTCRGQGFAVRQRPALRGPSGTPGKTSILMVGVAGFEPTTFRPPGGRATRLRHTPKPVLSKKWSGRPGSNRRHSDWKSDALPTELHPRNFC